MIAVLVSFGELERLFYFEILKEETMDETKQGQQGDITSAQQDGSTSGETELLPKSTVEAMVSKARSDALSELGRYKKAADEAVRQVQAVEERLSRLQEERFEAELEAVKEDPDRLREIRQRQRETKERMSAETERRRWESEKAAYDERIKKAEAIERRELAREVATEFKVDYKTLERFGTDKETMGELAKSLPKSGDAQGGQVNLGNRVTEPPESGKTKGISTGKLTVEAVQKMSPEERANRSKEIAEMDYF